MSSNEDQPPAGPPPSYSQATGSSTASKGAHNTTTSPSSHLQVPNTTGSNAIPIDDRRSMEDEARPLPAGWVRQYDTSEGHQFFVDTKANPPRSIWHHPYDDDEYLRTLSSEEREHLQESDKLPSHKLHDGESTDEEGSSTSQRPSAELPPRPGAGDRRPSKGGFGTKLKDKLTGTTKEERQRQRAQRAEEERQYYEAHQKFRIAMDQAMRTGQPVFFAKDKDGRDVYVEPPGGPGGYRGQAPQYGAQQGRPGQGGRMINPYSNGPYADPNARFIRPQQPYNRPYGYGYGG
jgi:hypothetical protein